MVKQADSLNACGFWLLSRTSNVFPSQKQSNFALKTLTNERISLAGRRVHVYRFNDCLTETIFTTTFMVPLLKCRTNQTPRYLQGGVRHFLKRGSSLPTYNYTLPLKTIKVLPTFICTDCSLCNSCSERQSLEWLNKKI